MEKNHPPFGNVVTVEGEARVYDSDEARPDLSTVPYALWLLVLRRSRQHPYVWG
jgi:hypothetical protein